jgi:hypothetical protein
MSGFGPLRWAKISQRVGEFEGCKFSARRKSFEKKVGRDQESPPVIFSGPWDLRLKIFLQADPLFALV